MDSLAQATQAAESVLEENISFINRATLWLTGTAGTEWAEEGDRVYINVALIFSDGELFKTRHEIPEELKDELDTSKAVMGYVVEFLINHLILSKYQEKFEQ